MAGHQRPLFVLFGASFTEYSFQPGGWGASLVDYYSRKGGERYERNVYEGEFGIEVTYGHLDNVKRSTVNFGYRGNMLLSPSMGECSGL